METTSFQQPDRPVFAMDESMGQSLQYAAKWSRFLAIIGFIMIGLTILGSIFCGLFMDRFMMVYMPDVSMQAYPKTALSVIYIVMAVLYFFPCLYLMRFGVRVRQTFKNKDLPSLRSAFENLHFFYRFIGILTIIWLIISILVMAAVIIGLVMGYDLNNY